MLRVTLGALALLPLRATSTDWALLIVAAPPRPEQRSACLRRVVALSLAALGFVVWDLAVRVESSPSARVRRLAGLLDGRILAKNYLMKLLTLIVLFPQHLYLEKLLQYQQMILRVI